MKANFSKFQHLLEISAFVIESDLAMNDCSFKLLCVWTSMQCNWSMSGVSLKHLMTNPWTAINSLLHAQ